MDCPGSSLERVLPLLGLGIKNAMLIVSDRIVVERFVYSAVRGVRDMKTFEDELMEHINGCDSCRDRYTSYLEKNSPDK